jgi:hypothetical protein
VLLDGPSAWMARKGFNAVDELRGMLSVPRPALTKPHGSPPGMSTR